eukprot:Skav203742  [mRNA]  locus=scaffold68:451273:455564:+ [translate_table: standard]
MEVTTWPGHDPVAAPVVVLSQPRLLGLAQTPEPMAAQAIYSLVCTFNLFSRLVPGSELSTAGDGGHLPALSLLDHEVRHCSVRVGQTAQVQVLRSVAPAPRTAGGATEHRGSEDRRSTARFPEVRRIPGAEEQSVAVTTTGHVDWKLCLVFPHVNAGKAGKKSEWGQPGYSNELVRHVQGVLVAPEGHAKAQLLPWMSLILNLATCYAAAVYANLEAFARDLASAEDSGNASLRGQLQREPTTERSRQEKSEIAMTAARLKREPSVL